MKARLIGGAAMIAAIAGIIALDLLCWPRLPVMLVIAGVALLGTFEYISMVRRAGLALCPRLLVLAAVVQLAIAFAPELRGAVDLPAALQAVDAASIALGLLLACLLVGVLRQDVAQGFDAAVWTAGGFLFVPAALSTLIAVRCASDGQAGVLLVLFLVAVAKSGDIFGYFVGRAIGRHKAIPGVSPGKSWEGCGASLLGATALAGVLGTAAGWLPPRVGLPGALAAGIIINLASQFGDLSASLLKRRTRVKDSARLLPGFGGIIDLVDSLLFAGPVFLAWLAFIP